MKHDELIKALRRLKVKTGSLACLGCGHEHNCSTAGCALLREAIAEVEARQIERLALHLAAEVMLAAGVCRYDNTGKCHRHEPSCNDCTRCLERWLCSNAKKLLAKKTKRQSDEEIDAEAMAAIDRHEAEFGADGYRAFGGREDGDA